LCNLGDQCQITRQHYLHHRPTLIKVSGYLGGGGGGGGGGVRGDGYLGGGGGGGGERC
jgi:hypothetical protein